MTSDAEPQPVASSISSRMRMLEGKPVLATLGLLVLFMFAHAVVLWLLDMLIDWIPGPPWDEVAESLGVALLCTPLMLVLIRRFERRTRLALEAMDIASDGFLILDPHGRLVEVNQGYAQMSGYSSGELLQLTIDQLVAPAPAAAPHPPLASVATRGPHRYEGRHRRKDGGQFDVEVTTVWLQGLDCVGAFVRTPARRDSTEPAPRHAAQAARQAFDLTTAGLCAVDAQGRCTAINPAALKMLDREHDADMLLGAPAHDLFHARALRLQATAASACPICDAHRSGQALQLQGPVLRRFDGSSVDVRFWSQPLVRDGVLCGAIDTFVEQPGTGA